MESEVDAFIQRVAGNLRVNNNIAYSIYSFPFISTKGALSIVPPGDFHPSYLVPLIDLGTTSVSDSIIIINLVDFGHYHNCQDHDPHNQDYHTHHPLVITVNEEYVKLLVAQPEGGSGGPDGTRRNEHG